MTKRKQSKPQPRVGVARFVRALQGWRGDAALYKLTPPLPTGPYVVVSAVHAMFTGAETFIFPANATGRVAKMNELEGSQRGTMSHAVALLDAGYELDPDEPPQVVNQKLAAKTRKRVSELP